MILKSTAEMLEQTHRPGNDSSILNRRSSKQSLVEIIESKFLFFSIGNILLVRFYWLRQL